MWSVAIGGRRDGARQMDPRARWELRAGIVDVSAGYVLTEARAATTKLTIIDRTSGANVRTIDGPRMFALARAGDDLLSLEGDVKQRAVVLRSSDTLQPKWTVAVDAGVGAGSRCRARDGVWPRHIVCRCHRCGDRQEGKSDRRRVPGADARRYRSTVACSRCHPRATAIHS